MRHIKLVDSHKFLTISFAINGADNDSFYFRIEKDCITYRRAWESGYSYLRLNLKTKVIC